MGHRGNLLDFAIALNNLQLSNSIVPLNHGPECPNDYNISVSKKEPHKHVQQRIQDSPHG